MNIIVMLFAVIAFIAGLAGIPLIAYTVGPMLPAFLSELVASIPLALGLTSMRNVEIVQTENGHYEFNRVPNPESRDSTAWSRMLLARVGISFEASEAAFDSMSRRPEDIEDKLREDNPLPVSFSEAPFERGDKKWYVSLEELRENDLLVPIGRKLHELEGASGTQMGLGAINQALAEYGGDTSDYSAKLMIAGLFMFAFLGMGMGYLVFF